MADAVLFQRPGHADLEQPEPDFIGVLGADAEIIQRLQHIQIGFAGGDNTEARFWRVQSDPVQPIGPGEG